MNVNLHTMGDRFTVKIKIKHQWRDQIKMSFLYPEQKATILIKVVYNQVYSKL